MSWIKYEIVSCWGCIQKLLFWKVFSKQVWLLYGIESFPPLKYVEHIWIGICTRCSGNRSPRWPPTANDFRPFWSGPACVQIVPVLKAAFKRLPPGKVFGSFWVLGNMEPWTGSGNTIPKSVSISSRPKQPQSWSRRRWKNIVKLQRPILDYSSCKGFVCI